MWSKTPDTHVTSKMSRYKKIRVPFNTLGKGFLEGPPKITNKIQIRMSKDLLRKKNSFSYFGKASSYFMDGVNFAINKRRKCS